jgi:hypothetical protein
MDPIWLSRFALDPERVSNGEYWRFITFLALPISQSPIWVIFSLWFLYFIINTIEQAWGEFQTTLYTLISITLMIGFSLLFQFPITQVSAFESTLFLAAAALFPEMEVQLFFIIPVKIKWLAWLTMGLVLFNFLTGSWVERFYLLAIYMNYLLFFGPAQVSRIKQIYRKHVFQSKMRK